MNSDTDSPDGENDDGVSLTNVEEAFRLWCEESGNDPDTFELVSPGSVDPDDVGDGVVAVFEHFPKTGSSGYFEVGEGDVFTTVGELREHGAAYTAVSLIPNDIPAVVEYGDRSFKPFGYGDVFDEDDEPTDPAIRFVRVAE